MGEPRRDSTRTRACVLPADDGRVAGLHALLAAFTRTLSRGEAARVVLDHGMPVVGALGGAVQLVNDEGSELEYAAAGGVEGEIVERVRKMPIAAPFPACDAIRTGAPVWLDPPELLDTRYPRFVE